MAALAGLIGPPTWAAAGAERIEPIAPADGAVTGPRPVFEIGYEGADEIPARDLRFRLVLEGAGVDGDRPSVVLDQRRRGAGWLPGEGGRVLYRPRKPLPDGEYLWKAAAWNGVEWVSASRAHRLRVDSIPPGDVRGLRLRPDPSGGRTLLEWPPVVVDREGGPEFVVRYHVYRYPHRGPFRIARLEELAVTEQPRFVDDDPPASDAPILFYKITAEDEAGNEADLRN